MPCGVIWHLDVKVTDWQGKKINSKRPVPAKASGEVARGVGKSRIGALAGQRDEAKHGESRQTLCQGILAWEMQEEGISHLLEHPSLSPALQHRGLGPYGGADPDTCTGGLLWAEPGKLGFTHVVRGFDFTVVFFCPCSGWGKEGLLKKIFLSWPLGKEKKPELNKSLILVILKPFLQFFYLTNFYWF